MPRALHVVTGGPGSGKTSLIAALAAHGLHTMPEAGRAVIREEVGRGGSALPWADRKAFAARMLARDLQSYRAGAALPGPVVFDRGIPDIAGYLRLCGLPVSAAVGRAATRFRYAPRVFVAPPWRAIFTQDAERRQSFAEAVATCVAMREAYAALGYVAVELPLASVAERAGFVARLVARG